MDILRFAHGRPQSGFQIMVLQEVAVLKRMYIVPVHVKAFLKAGSNLAAIDKGRKVTAIFFST
jgi:hypothetical protein